MSRHDCAAQERERPPAQDAGGLGLYQVLFFFFFLLTQSPVGGELVCATFSHGLVIMVTDRSFLLLFSFWFWGRGGSSHWLLPFAQVFLSSPKAFLFPSHNDDGPNRTPKGENTFHIYIYSIESSLQSERERKRYWNEREITLSDLLPVPPPSMPNNHERTVRAPRAPHHITPISGSHRRLFFFFFSFGQDLSCCRRYIFIYGIFFDVCCFIGSNWFLDIFCPLNRKRERKKNLSVVYIYT